MQENKPHGVESPVVTEIPPESKIKNTKYRLMWKECGDVYYETNNYTQYLLKVQSISLVLLKYLVQDPIIIKFNK